MRKFCLKLNNSLKSAFIFLFFIFIYNLPSNLIAGQIFDTKGNDFWLAFMPNIHASSGISIAPDSLYIFVVCEEDASGTITYFDSAGAKKIQPFSITSQQPIYTFKTLYDRIELSGFLTLNGKVTRNQSEMIAKNSFHVVTNKDVTVYALDQAQMTSDAWIVLPTDVLGTDHFIMAYNSDGNLDQTNTSLLASSSAPSEFAIIATQNGSHITINKSSPSMFSGNNKIDVDLNEGEVYLVQSLITNLSLKNDLTGSEIISNKPVAVLAGHQRSALPNDDGNSSASRDFLCEQMAPITTWGKNAFIAPYVQPQNQTVFGNDIFRVLACYDNTDIFINGLKAGTLNKGQYLQRAAITPQIISSSQPMLVAQFKKTANDAGTGSSVIGDPFMMMIPPKEQFLNNYIVINNQVWENGTSGLSKVYTRQYITLVAPDRALSSVKLDGSVISANNFSSIPTSSYSYANLTVLDGIHTIEASEGVGVYVYGYGNANSYGYVGGMGLSLLDTRPPQLITQNSCFSINGTVTDSTETDSKLKEVISPSSSQSNVNVTIETFTPYKNLVHFSASLTDTRKDGEFLISATDSIGYNTQSKFVIPGFTLSLNGKELNDTLPVISFNPKQGLDTCLIVKYHNYGAFDQTIDSIYFPDISTFSLKFSGKYTIKSSSVDSVKICFKSNQQGIFRDTLYIKGDCKTAPIAILVARLTDCDPTAFEYQDFAKANNILLSGYSQPKYNYIRLVNTKVLIYGSMWTKNRLPVKDGFTTTFKFRFSNGSNNNTIGEHSYPGADGIAFLIQNDSNLAVGNAGGGIGYESIKNALAVEFDTFNNDSSQVSNYNDPNGNHIAVQTGGTGPISSIHNKQNTLGITTQIPTIRSDGSFYYSKIDYNIVPNALRIWLDTVETLTNPVLIVNNLDLSKTLRLENGAFAYLGFTGATGIAWQNEDIMAWKVCPAPTDAILDVKDESLVNEQDFICYPNPMFNETVFEFNTLISDKVSLKIFDYLGKEVANLLPQKIISGTNKIIWNPIGIPQGIYYANLKCGDFSKTIKVTVLK